MFAASSSLSARTGFSPRGMHRLFLIGFVVVTLLASNPARLAGADQNPETITQDELVRRTRS